MILAADALLQLLEAHLPPALLDHLASYGDLDSQELIALAILAGTGFEKARKACHLGGVGMRSHRLK